MVLIGSHSILSVPSQAPQSSNPNVLITVFFLLPVLVLTFDLCSASHSIVRT